MKVLGWIVFFLLTAGKWFNHVIVNNYWGFDSSIKYCKGNHNWS